MRSLITVLSSIFIAGMFGFATVGAVFGDDRQEALKEWNSLAGKRIEFEVSDETLIPRRLALAADETGCSYREMIQTRPVRFIKLGSRRLAIVSCFAIIGSDRMYDLSDLWRPRLVAFPFLAQPDGFGTTSSPGAVTWKKENRVFLAETGSDLLPTRRVRHTYRFDETLADGLFVVVRVEIQRSVADGWTTIWQTPQWSFPSIPR